MPSQMASTGPLVVGRDFECHVHHENAFSRNMNFLMNLINHSGSPEIVKNFGVGTYGPIRRPIIRLFKEGESVIRLSLGRRLVNLLPVAKQSNALTNGVVGRPWVVGREFESHVHHENAF